MDEERGDDKRGKDVLNSSTEWMITRRKYVTEEYVSA
jgi:hypothetical protein